MLPTDQGTANQITTMYFFTPTNMTKSTFFKQIIYGDMEKLEHLYSANGNVKWYIHTGKEFGISLKC